MFEFKMYINYMPICASDLSVSFEQAGCGYAISRIDEQKPIKVLLIMVGRMIYYSLKSERQ